MKQDADQRAPKNTREHDQTDFDGTHDEPAKKKPPTGSGGSKGSGLASRFLCLIQLFLAKEVKGLSNGLKSNMHALS
jgi:hypothetical protein